MWQTRDSIWPVVIALTLAAAVHVVAVPGFAWLLAPGAAGETNRNEDGDDASNESPMRIGRSPQRVAQVAWIPYESYQEMIAPESRTRQPALQKKAEPVERAPMELNPTPPAPNAKRQAAAPSAQAAPHSSAFLQPEPRAAPLRNTTAADSPFKVRTARARRPAQPKQPAPPQRENPQRASAAGQPARPTAAPRSDREALPTDLTTRTHRVQPGTVITAGDIEIKTATPQLSIITRSSTIFRNPKAAITFAPDGEVTKVELLRSSGAGNVDGPVEASLYKWRATGKGLERIDEPFTIRIDLLLHDES